jgi:hypothetical protein
MDNEIDYYNALVNFIKFDLEKACGENWKDVFDNGGLTDHMREYFENLIESVLLVNWSCSGMFRIYTPDLDDPESDDFDDMDGGRSDTIEYEYHRETNAQGFNGVEFVIGWVKSVAKGNPSNGVSPLGSAVFAEAVIKLARWGERKPRCLKLEGKDMLFSLLEFKEVVPATDFSKLYPVLSNGRELLLAGIVEGSSKISDKEFCDSEGVTGSIVCPVGFVTLKSFEGDFGQIIYVSMLDVVSEYVSGNKFIDGIDIGSDGKFVIDEGYAYSSTYRLNTACKNALNDHNCAFYVSESLAKFSQEINAKAKMLCDLYVIESLSVSSGDVISMYYQDWKFNNFERLKQVVYDFNTMPLKVATLNVAHRILPIYMRVSDKWDGSSLGSLMDLYYACSDAVGFKNSIDFYGNVSEEVPSAGVKMLSELDKFESKAKVNLTVDVGPLIASVNGSDHFISIYRNKGDESSGVKPLFRLCKKSGDGGPPGYIIVANDEIPAGVDTNNCSFLNELWPHFWRIMSLVMSGSVGANPQVKFASKDTAEKVFKAVASKSGG